MRQSKILSRDTESCRQLQSPGQFCRINNVFNQNPNNLQNGNRNVEFRCINLYTPDQKSNPTRRNTFGLWHSFQKIKEIKDEGGNTVGYKQEYDFIDNKGKRNGMKMREYTRYKRGENDISLCVIRKKKKYYRKRKREMEGQPNEEHRSSLAPAPLQARSPTVVERVSQFTNLNSSRLSVSDNDNPGPWLSICEDDINAILKIYFPKGHELQNDPNFMFSTEFRPIYNGHSVLRRQEEMENEEHKRSLAPTSLLAPSPTIVQRREPTTPGLSQITNLDSATLNASDEKFIQMDKILFTEDSELQIDPNSMSNIENQQIYNELSMLLRSEEMKNVI